MSAAAEAEQTPPRYPRSYRRPPAWAIQSLALVAGLALWEIGARAMQADWLPPFSDVIDRLGELWAEGELESALIQSLGTLVLAYAIAVVAAVAIGLAMATIRPLRYGLGPIINALLATPALVLAPVFFVFFGLSQWTLIAIILVFAMPTIVVATITALTSVDERLQEMARSMGATRWELFRLVTLRSALPLLFVGLRLGLARSVKGMVTGQLVVSVVGLGGIASHAIGTFDAAAAMGVAVITVAIALVTTAFLQAIDGRLNAWVD